MKLTHFMQKNKALGRFSLFLGSFIVMGFVLADEHHYRYPADTFYNSQNRYKSTAENTYLPKNYKTIQSRQYSYPPLTKEFGSNPFTRSTNSTHRYASDSDRQDEAVNGQYTAPELSSAGYSYLPPMQKPGSNPYYRNKNQYVSSYPQQLPQKKARYVDVNGPEKVSHEQVGTIYSYAPLTKKLGSNPFNNPTQYYADTQSEASQNHISEADQKKYRYLYYYQPKPRYIESDNGYMSYADTHLMYP